MNSPFPVPPGPRSVRRHGWARRLVNTAVALAVVAVAAAAFVFSYDGVHAFALLGGMSPQLARFYPGLFDAVLVIACVAAAVLHDARWWARLWAWVVAIAVLAAIGATDVLHATGITLRHRPTEGAVAGAPVVAVLLAFSLLLTVLRQSRGQAATADVTDVEPARAAVPAGFDVPALPPAEPATVALEAAPTVASPAVTAPPVPGVTLAEPPAPGTARAAAVPAVSRLGPPETPIALPAGPRADPAPARGEQARETAARPAREVPRSGIPLARDAVGAGDIRLTSGPVLQQAGAEPPGQADAIPVTPHDGLPVMRRTAARADGDAVSGAAGRAETEAGAGPVTEAEPVTDAVPAVVTAAAGDGEAAVVTAAAAVTAAAGATGAAGDGEPAAGPRPAAAPRPGIRYAGSGSAARGGRPVVAEPEPGRHGAPVPSAATGDDYCEADDSRQYAGLVYTAGAGETDEPETRAAPAPARRPAAANGAGNPPFAGGLLAPASRLNRVRSTPAPPDDEDE